VPQRGMGGSKAGGSKGIEGWARFRGAKLFDVPKIAPEVVLTALLKHGTLRVTHGISHSPKQSFRIFGLDPFVLDLTICLVVPLGQSALSVKVATPTASALPCAVAVSLTPADHVHGAP
jgi:hypothetical protein